MTTPNLGFGGVLETIFIISYSKSVAQNRMILLHGWLVTVRFHFGKTREIGMFMIFGLLDVCMTPKTNSVSGDAKLPKTVQEIQTSFSGK